MENSLGIKFLLMANQCDEIRARGNVSAQARAVGLNPAELFNALSGRRKLPLETIRKLMTLPKQQPPDDIQRRDTTITGIYAKIDRLEHEIASKQAYLARLKANITIVEDLMGVPRRSVKP